MDANPITDDTSLMLSKMLEMTFERQKVISNNLANVNTPGYIRQEVDFELQMKKLIEAGDISGLEDLKANITKDLKNPVRLDGNNVDIGMEINELMENSLSFNLLGRAYKTRMNILRTAIQGR
ncbi:MAG: flagellar basal body rod protein FlgB [Lentisphaeria bacterium]|nr:flagellar basal body rod protein FlgB [Lentisphaeria bacterium]NQZ69369.1 flagellar basal body rod protein FlgB [Lentisphaeria bacterium]